MKAWRCRLEPADQKPGPQSPELPEVGWLALPRTTLGVQEEVRRL